MTIAAAVAKKLRGGYYTPSIVAEWLSNWAVRSASDRVLEPSCGDGAFLAAAAFELERHRVKRQKISGHITAVELIAEEAEKARRKVKSIAAEVVEGDFFEWLIENPETAQFDAVLGNPPFIRYQNFPEPSRTLAMDFMKQAGLRPNRLTNMWVPFVVAGISLLKKGGRLAMVIPAELLQVTYAGQLRQYLADSFERLTIYTCNEMFFESAEQEVVLLLADGKLSKPNPENKCDISLIEAATISELVEMKPNSPTRKARPKFVQHESEKWLKYFLEAKEIDFMRALRDNASITALAEHGSVDVGVVTGNNDFFVLDQDQVRKFELSDFVFPLVGRSSQLAGAVINSKELHGLADEGKRVFLLHLTGHSFSEFTSGLRKLIEEGEAKGVHLGYKCSIRKPWYNVPAVWEPDCFFFRQIYDFPRVVVNKAKATSTDTIHRLRCTVSASKLAANLYTHLTAASAEIEGRSYGGGVLELEPTEAERLLVPRALNGAMPIAEADKLVRDGRLKHVLEQNDRVVLQGSLGLSKSECEVLKQIWQKMRDRRTSRRKR